MKYLNVILITVLFTSASSHADQNTASSQFTDSSGRTIKFKYSYDAGWDTSQPRGVIISFHGNQTSSEEGILNGHGGTLVDQSLALGYVAVTVASPDSRETPSGPIRVWVADDIDLVDQLLRSNLNSSLVLDLEKVIFVGASAGSEFLHWFLGRHGENYGGGLLASCGNFNNSNRPSNFKRDGFRVAIHNETSDFLLGKGYAAFGYYNYALGFETISDFSHEGEHCSGHYSAIDKYLGWLTRSDTISTRAKFEPYWERRGDFENVIGLVANNAGVLFAATQTSEDSITIWSNNNSASEFVAQQTISGIGNALNLINDNALVLSTKNGVWRSTNYGSTWIKISDIASEKAVVGPEGSLMLIGSSLWVSEDEGDTWENRNPGNISSGAFINDFSPFLLNRGWNGTKWIESFSLDEGKAWKNFESMPWKETTDDRFSEVSSIAWDGEYLWAVTVHQGMTDRGLYRSDNLGNSWTRIVAPNDDYLSTGLYMYEHIHAADGLLFLSGNDLNTFISRDDGSTWQRTYGLEGSNNSNRFFTGSQNEVYAYNQHGIFKLVSDPFMASGPVVYASAPGIPNTPPIVSIVGSNRWIADTDDVPGERVVFKGIASDPDGAVNSAEWLMEGSVIASGNHVIVDLPAGTTTIAYRVVDNEGLSSVAHVTIDIVETNSHEQSSWLGSYNNRLPSKEYASGLGSVGVILVNQSQLYSCVRIFENSSPVEIDGFHKIDVTFNLISIEQGLIQLMHSRPYAGGADVDGFHLDCSGSFESTTGIYRDFIKLDDVLYEAVFKLVDDASLEFVLIAGDEILPLKN
tara:strand:- start:53941 stop:56355 length:2415 start_codon:yes stop_codon:yes gene_type:complete